MKNNTDTDNRTTRKKSYQNPNKELQQHGHVGHFLLEIPPIGGWDLWFQARRRKKSLAHQNPNKEPWQHGHVGHFPLEIPPIGGSRVWFQLRRRNIWFLNLSPCRSPLRKKSDFLLSTSPDAPPKLHKWNKKQPQSTYLTWLSVSLGLTWWLVSGLETWPEAFKCRGCKNVLHPLTLTSYVPQLLFSQICNCQRQG